MREDTVDNKAGELRGSGGGKGGGGSARVAQEAPNTLQSASTAKIIDLISEGEIEGLTNGLQSVFFDDTPLQNEDGSYNFTGVNITTRDGTPDQSHIAGFPSVENTTSVGVQVFEGTPVTRSITNLDADAVRATVNIPALTKQDTSTGDLNGYHVEIAFDISANGGAFSEVKRDTISGKTTSPYQRSYRLPLDGTGPWEIRMRRVTEDAPDSSIRNDTFFSAFTEIIDSKLSYPDSALVAVEVEAQQFGSSIPKRAYDVKLKRVRVPSNYDPVNRTYDGIWDGTFKIAWTDNPAWCFMDLALSERYGAGLESVSKWDLYVISQYCDEMIPDGFGGQEPRFTFNAFIQSRSEAIEVLQNVVSVFRGMLYWGQDTVAVTHDATPAGGVTRMFSPSNVIDGRFNYAGSALRERHSVALVSWNDPDDDYRLQVEVVEDAEAIQNLGWKQKDVTSFGCTSRGQAHRVGKWILDSERNETDVVTFTIAMEEADVRPGELILVSDPSYLGVRLAGRVKSSTTSSVTVDNIPSDIGSHNWQVIVRLPDGSLISRGVDSFDGNTINITGQFFTKPVKNTAWMLTANEASPRYFRVLMVSEQEEGHLYKVEAVEHDPTKYARVEQGIHLEAPDYTTIPTGATGAPSNLTAEPFTYRAGDNKHMGLTISWSPSDDARVMRYLGEAQGPNDVRWVTHHTDSGTSFDISDVEAGEWQFRVRALTGTGVPSSWITMTTTIGQLLEPVMPQTVVVDAKTFSIMLDPQSFYPNQQYEFWRSTVTLDESQIESNAIHVGTGSQITDTELSPLTDYFYYIRGVNSYGVSGWYPVQATTEKNPDVIMDIITGEIQQGDLWPGLQEDVEQITINKDNITSAQNQIDQTQDDLAQTQTDLNNEVIRIDGRIDDTQADLAQTQTDLNNTQDDLNNEIIRIDGRVDDAQADLSQTQTDLSNTQTELDNEITRVDGRIDSTRADLSDEADRLDGRVNSVENSLDATRTDLEATDAALEQRMSEAETNIVNEQEVRKQEDSFIINDIRGIQTLSEDNTARIASMNRVIEEANELEAIQFESINVETANRKASIRTEETVRTEEDLALAQRSDSLEASIDNNAAAITTEQQARVDGDSILSSQIGELSAKVDALPQFASGFESGSDFDQWNVGSSDTLTADTSDPYAGLQSGLLSSTATNPSSTGTTSVTYAAIPSGATDAFEGFEIRVRVAAKQPTSGASTEFAVAYSTASVGNSGWQHFTPTSSWQTFEFTWTVPEGSSDTTDYIGIWGDTSGSGLSVLVDGVNVQRVAGEIQEITAALQDEQQARIDGDEALTTQLNNLETTVGDNSAAITTEQQTRADADSAMASDISNLRVDVDDNSITIQQVDDNRVNADEALLQLINDTQVVVGENQTNITNEQTARVNADNALSDRIDSVEVISGDNQAAITEEASLRASEDEALALSIERMEVDSNNQSASIDALQRIQQESGEIEAIQFESINVETANRSASIRTEEQVRVEEDSVLAQRSTALETRMGDAESSITAEETARINEDNALASSISALQTEVDGNTSAITNEQTARVNADNALASDISALQTEVDGNTSSITTEQQARIDGDNALASDITSLQTEVDDNSSAITTEQQTRANADDALASDISSLSVRVDDAEADIISEQTTRANADSALASDISALQTEVDDNAASIISERTARIDGDNALASDISGLHTQVDGNASSITTEQQTRASADDALASDITGLRSDVDSNSASITTEQQTRASADDALASDISALEASVGDDFSSIQTQLSAEIVGNSIVADGSFIAGDASLWLNSSNISVIPRDPNGSPVVADAPSQYIAQYSNHTGGGSRHTSGQWRDVSPGDTYSVKMDYTARSSTDGTLQLSVQWRDVNNSLISWPTAATVGMVSVSGGIWETTSPVSLEVPDGAVQGRVVITAHDTTSGNPVFTNVVASRADAAMTQRVDVMQTEISDAEASIQNEQTARINADDVLASDISSLQTSVGDNAAAITSEQNARTSADDALAQDISVLQTDVDDNSTAITNEQTARVNADDALASDITALEARVGDNESAIQTEATARADADSAQVERTDTLYARVDRMSVWTSSFEEGDDLDQWSTNGGAAIVSTSDPHSGGNCVLIRSDDTSANSANGSNAAYAVIPQQTQAMLAGKRIRVSLFARQYDANPAGEFAVSYSTTSAGNSGWNRFSDILLGTWKKFSFTYDVPESASGGGRIIIWGDSTGSAQNRATVVDDISIEVITEAGEIPEIGANQAAIQTEEQARIDGDDALASEITTVQTNLNGEISSVEQTMQSQIDDTTGRIEAMYSIRTDVNGYVSGIGLANDGQESEIAMRTDRFYIAQPGVSDSEVVPFIVDNGVTYLDEAMIKSLTFSKLQDSTGNFVVDSNGRLKAEYIVVGDLQSSGTTTDGYPMWRLDQNGWFEINGSGSSGRTRLTDEGLKVYDSSGQLRVRLGVW